MSPLRVCHSPYVSARFHGAFSYTVTFRSSSMSSNTAIFSRPTTVIFRILCGSSHDRCMCAIFPDGKAKVEEPPSRAAFGREVGAGGDRLFGLLVEEVEDDRQVVDAERPERVLVRPDDAEVLAVPVDTQNLSQ